MATVQHMSFPRGDWDQFAPSDGMHSSGSPYEAIPTRRNPDSQDLDAWIPPRRDFARGSTPRDLDSPFPICVSPLEEWSSSPWASCDPNDSSRATRGCEGFDSDLMAIDINTDSVTTRLIKPSFDSPATHIPKASRLGLESSFTWQYDESNFSNFAGLTTDYKPESYYPKPAAPKSGSGYGERNIPCTAPKTSEGSQAHDSLSWSSLETFPFPAPSSGSSFSERSMATSKTQKSSRALHAVVNMISCDSYRSATNTPSSIGEDITAPSIHWQSSASPGYDRYLNPQIQTDAGLLSASKTCPINTGCASKAMKSESSPEILDTSVVAKAIGRNDCHRPHDTISVPNLSASSHDFSLTPPPPSPNGSPSLKPLQQCPRFPGDLYTPKFIRKEGKAREGWCGLCRPGRWLVLKNSAFWYDKSFVHGISAASGQAWEGPSQTRFGRKAEVWEGLCETCSQWITLTASKSGGVSWFRHAYKCHAHVKTKKTLKRPSEGGDVRDSKAKTVDRKRKDDDTVRVTGI